MAVLMDARLRGRHIPADRSPLPVAADVLAPANLAEADWFAELEAELAAQLHPDEESPTFDWFGPEIEPPPAPWFPHLIGAEYPAPPLATLWRELAGDVTMTGWSREQARELEAVLAEGEAEVAPEVGTWVVPFADRSRDYDERRRQLADALSAEREPLGVFGDRLRVIEHHAPLRLPSRARRIGRWLRDAARRATRWATGWDAETRSYARRP